MKDIVFSDCFEYKILNISFLRRWHTFHIYYLHYLHYFQFTPPSATAYISRRVLRPANLCADYLGSTGNRQPPVTEDKPNEQGKLLVFPCC